jgi:dTDP-4-amino-4,6-dideoxygalactose transaminase
MSKLAIDGGTPVRDKPFPSWPLWGEEEEKALLEVLHSGEWSSPTKPAAKLAAFQQAFGEYQQAKHVLGVFNGTVALVTAFRAAGLTYGDEAIVPPYTFVATATACLSVGAIPVFADIDPATYNIDPERIEEAITPRTKAIVPVHIGGCPADMDAIIELARKHNLMVIEDACQAPGAAWKGRRVGAIGDMGCMSFQASKNVNAGEGGAVMTDDDELAVRAWSVQNCGRIPEGAWYQHEVLGNNYRMTEWQAAILLAQLGRTTELCARREANAVYLAQRMAEIPGVTAQARDERVTEHANHLFVFRYDSEAFGGLPRESFLAALRAEGIPASPGYTPLYKAGAIRRGIVELRRFTEGREVEYEEPDCPVTERACTAEGAWLGQTVLLGTKTDMDDIAEAILKIQKAKA